MQTSSVAAAAAFAAGDAKVWHRLLIAWPGGIHTDMSTTVVSAELEADLVTDMPDDTRDPVGYQSRTLKLVLGGQLGDGVDETDTVFKLLSPLNMASPFARMDLRGTTLTYDRGVYVSGSATPEWFRRFTGSIDDIEPGTDDTFSISCLDRMTMLRPVVSMPAVVTAPPYSAGLTSEFGHDALLRSATDGALSSWPAQRPQCVLAVGFRSSTWAEVGELSGNSTFPQPFVPGKFGSALDGIAIYTLSTEISGADAFAEAWMAIGSFASEIALDCFPNTGRATIDINQGSAVVTVVAGVSTATYTFSGLTIGSASRYLAWALHWPIGSTSWTTTLWVDGVATTSPTQSIATARSNTWTRAQVSADAVEAFQVTTESAPAPNNAFTPLAVLKPSTNTMLVTPAISGPPLDSVRDINAADRSTSGFDEFGVYRSTTRDSRRGGVSVGAYTSDSDLETVDMQLTGSGFANRVQVPVTSWTFGAAATVWSADTVHKVPGRSVGYTFLVDTGDQLVARVDGSIALRPNGGGTAGLSYFLASTDPNGVAPHGGVTNGMVTQIDATHFLVSFDNPWIRDAYLVAPYTSDLAVGTPCVQIGGVPANPADSILTDSQWPPLGEGGAKSTTRGEQPYTFADNAWRQDFTSAQALGDDTLCEMRRPVWVFTNVAIKADWRLQLGDRIHLTAPKLFLDDDVVIFGIQESMSDGTDTQTLNVRMVAPPGVWVLGQAGRDELGVNIYV